MGKHSKISPSKSERWINCPGSVLLEEQCPPQETSKYAAEGTAAHEIAALCLKRNENADNYLGEIVEVDDEKFTVDTNMAENIQIYLDAIRADMDADGVPYSELKVEHKFALKYIHPDLYGTLDAYYTSPFGKLRVYDLKFGRGTYVEVVDNTQLLTYGLGAWDETDRAAEEVESVIVQPRYEGEDPVRRCQYTPDNLAAFITELRKAVKRVEVKDQTLKVGEWCKFCNGISICKAKKEEIFAVIPAGKVPTEPSLLTIVQIRKVLTIADTLEDWVKGVRAHAESLAKTGVTIPGYKLVAKKGHRRWTDEIAVENAFEAQYGEQIYEKKLKSPAKLEKLVGEDEISEYVEVPDNGSQLVPDTAKGEAIKGNAAMFEKIK
jgi:hypothetical protein